MAGWFTFKQRSDEEGYVAVSAYPHPRIHQDIPPITGETVACKCGAQTEYGTMCTLCAWEDEYQFVRQAKKML